MVSFYIRVLSSPRQRETTVKIIFCTNNMLSVVCCMLLGCFYCRLQEAVNVHEKLEFVTYIHAPSLINNEGLESCIEPTTLMCGHEFSPSELDRCYRTGDESPRENAFLDSSAGFIDYFGQRANERKQLQQRFVSGGGAGSAPDSTMSSSFSTFLEHQKNFWTG